MGKKAYQLILVIFLVLLSLIWPINSTGVQAASNKNIKDDLGFLTAEELSLVQAEIDKAVIEHKLDIVIVFTDDTEGKSSRDFADDYYDYNGYGVGSDASGLLMLVNMGERELWISTTGEAISIFTDNRINDVLDIVAPYLSEENYYQAAIEFINQVKYFAAIGAPTPGIPGNKEEIPYYPDNSSSSDTYWEKVLHNMTSPAVYLVGIILALVGTAIASSGNKGRVTIDNRTYELGGSFQLIDKRDDFINQTVTRTRIPKNNTSSSGGGGSSIHRGSSGRSHGGGGRKF